MYDQDCMYDQDLNSNGTLWAEFERANVPTEYLNVESLRCTDQPLADLRCRGNHRRTWRVTGYIHKIWCNSEYAGWLSFPGIAEYTMLEDHFERTTSGVADYECPIWQYEPYEDDAMINSRESCEIQIQNIRNERLANNDRTVGGGVDSQLRFYFRTHFIGIHSIQQVILLWEDVAAPSFYSEPSLYGTPPSGQPWPFVALDAPPLDGGVWATTMYVQDMQLSTVGEYGTGRAVRKDEKTVACVAFGVDSLATDGSQSEENCHTWFNYPELLPSPAKARTAPTVPTVPPTRPDPTEPPNY